MRVADCAKRDVVLCESIATCPCKQNPSPVCVARVDPAVVKALHMTGPKGTEDNNLHYVGGYLNGDLRALYKELGAMGVSVSGRTLFFWFSV